MNSGVRHQVGLELVEVDVECAVEAKRSGDGRDDLRNQAVQILVARSLNSQIASTDIINCLKIL